MSNFYQSKQKNPSTQQIVIAEWGLGLSEYTRQHFTSFNDGDTYMFHNLLFQIKLSSQHGN